VVVSNQELKRVEVLAEVQAGQRTSQSAAEVLNISTRQVHRLLSRYRDGGAVALVHKARGRPSNYQLSQGLRELALDLVRQHYQDFGPTFAA
jgi:predicted ArsR family transcriptional regulator